VGGPLSGCTTVEVWGSVGQDLMQDDRGPCCPAIGITHGDIFATPRCSSKPHFLKELVFCSISRQKHPKTPKMTSARQVNIAIIGRQKIPRVPLFSVARTNSHPTYRRWWGRPMLPLPARAARQAAPRAQAGPRLHQHEQEGLLHQGLHHDYPELGCFKPCLLHRDPPCTRRARRLPHQLQFQGYHRR
jgi:hypothetical protein